MPLGVPKKNKLTWKVDSIDVLYKGVDKANWNLFDLAVIT
jgi:hypothetical protein